MVSTSLPHVRTSVSAVHAFSESQSSTVTSRGFPTDNTVGVEPFCPMIARLFGSCNMQARPIAGDPAKCTSSGAPRAIEGVSLVFHEVHGYSKRRLLAVVPHHVRSLPARCVFAESP